MHGLFRARQEKHGVVFVLQKCSLQHLHNLLLLLTVEVMGVRVSQVSQGMYQVVDQLRVGLEVYCGVMLFVL